MPPQIMRRNRGFTLGETIVAFALLGLVTLLIHTWGNVFITQGLEERWHTVARLKALQLCQNFATSPSSRAAWQAGTPASGQLLQGVPYELVLIPYTTVLPAGTEGVTLQLIWHPRPADTSLQRSISIGVVRRVP